MLTKLIHHTFYILFFVISFQAANATRANHLINTNNISGIDHKKKDKILNYRTSGMQKSLKSASGKFLIHYDIENLDANSFNAVPLEDNDQNGIPDYVDSVAWYFDYVYRTEVEEMGYNSPYPEPGGDDDCYDIYLMELGSEGYYGYTSPESLISSGSGKLYKCYYSYIVIDNDYSEKDSMLTNDGAYVQTYIEHGIDAMKITAAHEFSHAIQWMYGNTTDRLLHELTSCTMELRVFPNTKDYYQYVKSLFWNPAGWVFGDGDDADAGYRYGLFGIMIQQKFGDDVLRRMWELIGANLSSYRSLDSALKEQGSSLDDTWKEFLTWVYYTGTRAIPGEYFDFADEYPTLQPFETDDYIEPCVSRTGSLNAYEFRPYRVYLPGDGFDSEDTLDIIISNRGLEYAVARSNPDQLFSISVINENDNDYIKLGSSNYYYKITPGEDEMFRVIFHNSGEPTKHMGYAFPNPFRAGTDEKLFFPIPYETKFKEEVSLVIYNASMEAVYTGRDLTVEVHNGFRGVFWKDIPKELSAGVYIFQVISEADEVIGKFAVRR